jgi:hypothetical protein
VSAAEVPPLVARVNGKQDDYGAHDLWVNTEWTRQWRVGGIPNHGRYWVKWGTLTLRHGRTTNRGGPPVVTARRLDGPGTAAASIGRDSYSFVSTSGGISYGFWPTAINFPHTGCWRVTETHGGETVRFTMRVAA